MNVKRTESDGSGTSFGKLGFSLKKNPHGRRHSGDPGLFAGLTHEGEKEKRRDKGQGGGFCCDAGDVAGILDYMMMLFMNGRQNYDQIENFIASFSNFDVDMEELFNEFAFRYHRCTPSPITSSVSGGISPPTSPPSGKEGSKKHERKSSIVRRIVKAGESTDDLTQSASEPPKLSLYHSATFTKGSPTLISHSVPSLSSSSSSSSTSSVGSSPPLAGSSPSFLAPPPMIYPTPRSGSPCKAEKEFLQYFLKTWLFQFGSLYKRQCPLFFRKVASFLADIKDLGMNELKLLLLKNKTQSELDSALPFYQAINYANERPLVKSGFNSSLELSLFDHYSLQEMAEGITFVMFRVYSSIGPSELHDGSWQGEERMVRAPHVHALSVLFNRISYLCLCEIMGAKNHESRVEKLTKCSELAKLLKKMGNFEGMSAVTCVFSNASVQRLKPLWASIDSKTSKRIKQMESAFRPQKNYKHYTEMLDKATPPLLPWLAPKLRELRFMYDGNQKTASDGTLQYDFMQMVGQSVNRYLQFKRPRYVVPTPKSHLVHLLEAVPNLDPDYVEDAFYDCSTKILEGS